MKKSMLVLAVCGALALGAAPAFAGELTGSATNPNYMHNQGMSWCSFSGHNDDPTAPLDGPNGPGGHSQSYGQELRLGIEHTAEQQPGIACNPQRTEFGVNPNRTK